jgi:hypothetical protein
MVFTTIFCSFFSKPQTPHFFKHNISAFIINYSLLNYSLLQFLPLLHNLKPVRFLLHAVFI